MKDAEGTGGQGSDQKNVAVRDLFHKKNDPVQWFDIKQGQQNRKKGSPFEPFLKPLLEARPWGGFHSSGMSPSVPFDRPGAECSGRSEYGEKDAGSQNTAHGFRVKFHGQADGHDVGCL